MSKYCGKYIIWLLCIIILKTKIQMTEIPQKRLLAGSLGFSALRDRITANGGLHDPGTGRKSQVGLLFPKGSGREKEAHALSHWYYLLLVSGCNKEPFCELNGA